MKQVFLSNDLLFITSKGLSTGSLFWKKLHSKFENCNYWTSNVYFFTSRDKSPFSQIFRRKNEVGDLFELLIFIH